MIQINTEFDLDTISERFDLGYTANEGGYLVSRDISCHKGFVIIAGDTELPEETLQSIPNYKTHETIVWSEDEAEWYSAATFELGTILYYVTVSEWDSLVNNARQFALEHTSVEDILFVQIISDSSSFIHGTMNIQVAEGVTPDETTFPELTDFTQNEDGSWTVSPGGDYAEEWAGIFDWLDQKYEAYAWLCDFQAMLLEKYDSSVLTSVYIPVGGYFQSSDHYNPTSIWATLGNPNGDDTVDASDAADILGYAAKSGSGDADAAISQSASDLTMDGVTDASDAAKLLQYAAYAGTSEGASLRDYLRNE